MHTPSDLADLLECEHRSILAQAGAAGLPDAPRPGAGPDQITVKHGRAHEQATLAKIGTQRTVVRIADHDPVAAAAETAEALRAHAPVVYQAVFHGEAFHGEAFHGRADFIMRTPDGRYEVYDTKLARHARPSAVIQLAAYADALARAGWPAGPNMHLLLGDGSQVTLRVDDFLPLLHRLRERLVGRPARMPERVWGDERPACSGCRFAEHCASGREADRDLALVAGMRADQRRKLVTAGITTIDALASAGQADRPAALSRTSFAALRAQAAIQVRQDATGQVEYEIVDQDALAELPPPSAGDVFFDMEGDPYVAGGAGLEYLFGLVADGGFTALWAHSRAEERLAFERFVDIATARLAEHPDAHVYHYAPYESAALKRLAALHGTRESAVDDLLRRGALVDLYAVVRKALRVSQRSYSIKALEPLYMREAREGEVKTAASSIEAYERYLGHVAEGEAESAQEVLRGIADYNEYDCVSTQRLFEFLHGVRAEHGIETIVAEVESVAEDDERTQAQLDRAARLEALVGALLDGVPDEPAERDPDQSARALLAALVGYHRRETNPAWWEYFRQLAAPLGELEADTTCAVPVEVDAGEWQQPSGRVRLAKRVLTLRCDPDRPHPFATGDKVRLRYGATSRNAVVTAASAERIELQESSRPDETTPSPPDAVLPGEPVRPSPKDEAVADLAQLVVDHLADHRPGLPAHPGVDLLRRHAPRLRDRTALRAPGLDLIETVVHSVDVLDGSTLAVQGPPGAGKTYLAGNLITHLVRTGRSVGVTSNSHKAVENVLAAALAMDPALPTAKRARTSPDPDSLWEQPRDNAALARWRAEHPGGHLVGGTAWHFTSAAMRAEPLDVLIVDEAGQFSLADALAVSTCARNLVLLGDPQQLPQVVQGTHPHGADASALGHLIGGADIIHPDLGYFLDQTRRMHPAVCSPVSRLSYAGRLTAHATAAHRSVDGVAPGLYRLEVDHDGNTTRSPEEAAAVVDVVTRLHGRPWRDQDRTRPLADEDILVVAPYNLQTRVVARALERAGHPGVRVGTVDRFQGQEAPVVIATMTSSSALDLPRGLDFLLSRNRLNVALSRAQALAVLVCSPRLVEADIRSVDQMRLISGMIGLLDTSAPWPG